MDTLFFIHPVPSTDRNTYPLHSLRFRAKRILMAVRTELAPICDKKRLQSQRMQA